MGSPSKGPWDGIFIGATVTILGLVLFPVFARSPAGSHKSFCLSNVKQQATALALYAGDYEDHLPPRTAWMDDLGDYLKSKTSYRCPLLTDLGLGYGFNAKVSGKAIGKIPEPSKTPLTFDSPDLRRNASSTPSVLFLTERHKGYASVSYCDAHAKSVRTDALR